MLTIETERRIAKFLIVLSEEELKVQRQKENLINNYDFNPYQCFKYLDKNSKESIDCYDIFNFMKENSEYITLRESYLIILFYDTKDQNYWSYDNFINYLLNGFINTNNNKKYDFINNNIEITDKIIKLLLNVFKSELELINNTMPLVKKIKERNDYNITDLFNCLTFNNDINKKNINEFLIRNGYNNYPDIKLNAIINRLSLSKNDLITYCDLQRLFEVGYCDNTKNDLYESMLNCPKNIIDNGYIKNDIQYRTKIDNNNDYENDISNNEKTNSSSNYFFKYNSEDDNDNDNDINNFNSLNKFDYDNNKENDKLSKIISLTKQKYKVLNKIGNNNNKNNLNNSSNDTNDIPEEKYFVDYLEYILGNENLIEKKKCELALRADFNIEDCIKIFKPNQLGEPYISQDDFIYGSQSLDLKFNKEEIKLFFCKYDLKSNGYLTFSDFFDMLVPFNNKYREMVENRPSMPYKPKYKTNEIFLDSTKNYLKELFQCICISEISIEKERHKLMRYLNCMSLDKIFSKIDKDKKGFIVPIDLLNYFKKWNVTVLDSDSDLVFIRIDRDRNGIITLNDIITETSLVLSENEENIN